MEYDGLVAKLSEIEIRLVRLETEWALRRQRETNMPGWVWAAVSALTAVVSALMWWIAESRIP